MINLGLKLELYCVSTLEHLAVYGRASMGS